MGDVDEAEWSELTTGDNRSRDDRISRLPPLSDDHFPLQVGPRVEDILQVILR